MTQRQLTADQAKALREDRYAGALGCDLAAKYGVRIDMVYDIVHGKTYQDVGGPISAPRPKLTPANVVAIRQAHACGESLDNLAAQYGIARMTVWDVVTGLSWTSVGGPRFQRQVRTPTQLDEVDEFIDEIAVERALTDIVADVPLSVRLTRAERDEVIRRVPIVGVGLPTGLRNIAETRLNVSSTTWRQVMAGAA